MLSFFLIKALCDEDPEIRSRVVTVDFEPDQTEYTAYLSEDETLVFVHTLDGFEATAYDFQDKEIGKFDKDHRIVETGLMEGKLIIKKTGSKSQFIFSIFIKNNLPLEKQCQEITVTNDATLTVSLTQEQLNSGRVQCIWLATPSEITGEISAQVSGDISVFNDTFSSIADLNEGEGETLSFTTSNAIISFRPSETGQSTSLSVTQSGGSNPSNVELTSIGYFFPTDDASFPDVEDAPQPEPQPSPSPSSETSSESSSESSSETSSETSTETSSETSSESSTVTSSESSSETSTESSTVTSSESSSETSTETSSETSSESSTATSSESSSQSSSETATEPSSETATEPSSESSSQSSSETATEPSSETATQPSSETTSQSSSETSTEPSSSETESTSSSESTNTDNQGGGDVNPDSNDKKEMALIIAIVVVSIVAVVAICLAVFFYKKSSRPVASSVDNSELIKADLI